MKALFSFLSILLIVLQADAQKTAIIQVAPFKYNCIPSSKHACYWISKSDKIHWFSYPNSIDSFVFEKGFQYTLRVKEKNLPNAIEDLPSEGYIVTAILAKDTATTLSKELNGDWQLLAYHNQYFAPRIASFNNGKFRIQDCNISNGEYIADNNGRVTFKPVMRTKMFCTPNDNFDENFFLQSLNNIQYYYIVDNKLYLYDTADTPFCILEKTDNIPDQVLSSNNTRTKKKITNGIVYQLSHVQDNVNIIPAKNYTRISIESTSGIGQLDIFNPKNKKIIQYNFDINIKNAENLKIEITTTQNRSYTYNQTFKSSASKTKSKTTPSKLNTKYTNRTPFAIYGTKRGIKFILNKKQLNNFKSIRINWVDYYRQ